MTKTMLEEIAVNNELALRVWRGIGGEVDKQLPCSITELGTSLAQVEVKNLVAGSATAIVGVPSPAHSRGFL
jgi:hypothetical protein